MIGLEMTSGTVRAIAEALADVLAERGLVGATVPTSPYLDVDQAADYLRASKQRVYDLVHAGALTPGRDGRRLLFRRDDLDAYLRGAA